MSPEQLERLSRAIAELEARLARLDREAGGIRGDLAALRASVAADAAERVEAARVEVAPAAAAAATIAVDATTHAAEPMPRAAEWTTRAAEPIPSAAEPTMRSAEPTTRAAESLADAGDGGFEQQVALVWFARLGALVLLCGVGYLYSYAVDRNWISPLARCLLGAGIGVALVGAAELLRRSTHALYVQVLLGLGVSFLYLSDYAAYSFYGLLTAPIALRVAAVISFAGGLLAMRHRSQAVFVFSLLGGFLAPLLLSTGEDQPAALFAYLLAVSASSLIVSLRERFLYAAWIAIAGAQLLFFAWYVHFFDASRAYHALPSRVAALGAVAVFTLETLVVYRRARGVFAQPMSLAFLLEALLFGHAGANALLFDQPLLAIAALLVLAFVAVVLLLREEQPVLMALPLVAGWVALAQLSSSVGPSWPLLGMLLWAAVYFAAAARDVVASEGVLAASRLLTASLAGIAAVALGLAHTGDDNELVRAALVAAVGVADGALAFLLRRRAAGRAVNLLVGQSIALLAIAAQFAFAPNVVTLAWALVATLAIVLAAQVNERDWLRFGLALWTVTLVRCFFRAFTPRVVIEIELCGCALALFAAWLAVRRQSASGFRFWSGWLLTAGHVLLLWALLMRLAAWVPALPDTLVLAGYATLLVAGGFVFRERQNRYLGLVLFGVTIAKLVSWDVFHRDVLFRVLVLIGVGVLLLGASFLYARYGRRLITFVRDGELRQPE